MILSDRELRIEIQDGHIKFEPCIDEDTQIQDASVDVRLGSVLRIPTHHEGIILSPHESVARQFHGSEATIGPGGYNLLPREFVLAHTFEKVTLPLYLAARLDGKSSLARLGLLVHLTSGHIAPGFDGIIVLEMYNVGPNTIALTPQMPVAQLIFEKLSMLPRKAYSGRFRGQDAP